MCPVCKTHPARTNTQSDHILSWNNLRRRTQFRLTLFGLCLFGLAAAASTARSQESTPADAERLTGVPETLGSQTDSKASQAPSGTIDYLRQVKPILMSRCSRCHNGVQSEGSLRLDSAAELLNGGDSGPAIVLGKSGDSRLIHAVLQNDDLKMPPEGAPLSSEQIAILRQWIDEGAHAPEDETRVTHWAFQKLERPAVPENAAPEWQKNSIDAFIATQHQQRKLVPAPEADKNTLLRRVYLDLIGLPPTVEQLNSFLTDPSPLAYENAVDQLLQSPHYGERWGRHWMDVWRYSDWDGYGAEVRESKPHIWRWRDWIIESLNADKPYDQMIVEMLAGDEAAPADPQTLRATGFLVRNWYTFNRNVWLDNIIEHTGKAFMGVTFNCARCHDHMYDPVSQSEYYQLRAFFEPHDIRTDRVPGQSDPAKDGLVRVYDANAATPTMLFVRGDEKNPLKDKPLSAGFPRVFSEAAAAIQPVTLPAESYNPGLQEFVIQETRLAARSQLEKATAELVAAQKTGAASSVLQKQVEVSAAGLTFTEARIAADAAAFSQPPAENARALAIDACRAERRLTTLQAQLKLLKSEAALADARAALKPDDAKLQKAVTDAEAAVASAQEARQKAEQAEMAEPTDTYTRVTPVYPVTSTGRRLALARWIVSPQNPLTARVAVNHLWLRHFHQPLVPTVFDFGMNGKPPSHPELLDWLAAELVAQNWKMKPIHRLIVTSATYRMASSMPAADANQVDADNQWLWRQNSRRMEAELIRDAALYLGGALDVTMYGPELDPAAGFTTGRRSIYFRSSKEKKMTFLATFDSANPVECYRRAESISPQQSLAMSNSPLILAQSRRMAKQLKDSSESTEQFIDLAFRQILCREVTGPERDECLRFMDSQTASLANTAALTAFSGPADETSKPSADPRLRAHENLIHVLFNHNDFVTIR